jgi:hypothetical protein
MDVPCGLFNYVGQRSWQQVLGLWAQDELPNPSWRSVYGAQGMSWFEWRRSTIEQFDLERRRWQLLHVRRPMLVATLLRGGEHPDWERLYYDGRRNPTFGWLAANSDVEDNPGVQRLLTDFPRRSTIVAVERGGSAIVADGMHRCSALAFAAHNGGLIDAELYLAIGE